MSRPEDLLERANRYMRSDAGRVAVLAIALLASIAVVEICDASPSPGGPGAYCFDDGTCQILDETMSTAREEA